MFLHTFDIDILTPDRKDVFASFPGLLISCVATEIPALLGVGGCLERFVLTIDYPEMATTLAY